MAIFKFIQTKAEDNSKTIIPKNIFNTWNEIPNEEKLAEIKENLIHRNPGWNYYLFDSQGRQSFIKKHFSKRVSEAYNFIIPGAYQADFFRYCVLYVYGGLYLDLGIYTLPSLDNFIDQIGAPFISVRDQRKKRIFNAIIFSIPKHPFLKTVINIATDNAHKGFYGSSDLDPTGPGALGKAINMTLGKRAQSPFRLGHQASGKHSFYLLDFYKKTGNQIAIFHEELAIFAEKIRLKEEHSEQLKHINYHYCWENDNVYTHGKVQRPINKPPLSLLRREYNSGNIKKARRIFYSFLKQRYFNFSMFLIAGRSEIKYLLSKNKGK